MTLIDGSSFAVAIEGTVVTSIRRQCSRCRKWRDLETEYHADRKAPHGRARRCKRCVSKQTAAWAARNRGRKNKTDREWKQRNRHKDHAHAAVRAALARGELARPRTCSSCSKPCRKPAAHHDDYNKPLAVRWLCRRCHATAHRWGHANVARFGNIVVEVRHE